MIRLNSETLRMIEEIEFFALYIVWLLLLFSCKKLEMKLEINYTCYNYSNNYFSKEIH